MQYIYNNTIITISPHTPQQLFTTSRYVDLATKIRLKIAGSNPATPTIAFLSKIPHDSPQAPFHIVYRASNQTFLFYYV